MHHFSDYWKAPLRHRRRAGISIYALLFQPPTPPPFLQVNAPSSTLLAEFRPQATSERSVASYQYQEALIERLPVARQIINRIFTRLTFHEPVLFHLFHTFSI